MSTQPDEREQQPAEMRYAVAPVTGIEVRDPSGNDDNTWTMSGYAAVFDQTTTLYDGRFLKMTESIAPDAFDTALRTQGVNTNAGVVHFNVGHDMNRAVAATDVPTGQPGSLTLRSDPKGLYFMAKVPRDDPDGVALASKLRSGVVKQASFAFTVADDERVTRDVDGVEEEHRTILEVGHLYDVCATPQGAYSSTVVGLRSYATAIGQPPEGEAARVSQPEAGGASTVSPDEASNSPDAGSGGGFQSADMERLAKQVAKYRARYPQL